MRTIATGEADELQMWMSDINQCHAHPLGEEQRRLVDMHRKDGANAPNANLTSWACACARPRSLFG